MGIPAGRRRRSRCRPTKENKPDILQYRLEVPSDGKVDAIAKILAHESYDRVICFCNTKGSTERLTKFLQMRGVDAECIHGDIPQRKREEVMQRFRDGKLRVFVATDVASPGHRRGRCGRGVQL